MKIGLVTLTPQKVEGYDVHVFYSKTTDGQEHPAGKEMQNDVTCFCDAKAIREDPSIVALSKAGPAMRKNRRFNLPFDYVCPTNPTYRAKVLRYIKDLNKENIEGVTLNLYHFPEQEFCVCPRCTELHHDSGLNWIDWRAQTVTTFLKEAKTLVKGTFAVEMYPDPLMAKERFGIDFGAIAELVAAPMAQANMTMRDDWVAISKPHAPRFPAVKSHLPKVQRQQRSQSGM